MGKKRFYFYHRHYFFRRRQMPGGPLGEGVGAYVHANAATTGTTVALRQQRRGERGLRPERIATALAAGNNGESGGRRMCARMAGRRRECAPSRLP